MKKTMTLAMMGAITAGMISAYAADDEQTLVKTKETTAKTSEATHPSKSRTKKVMKADDKTAKTTTADKDKMSCDGKNGCG